MNDPNGITGNKYPIASNFLPVHVKIGVRSQESGVRSQESGVRRRKRRKKKVFSIDIFYIYI
jgi:hypothetical protein